MDIDLEVDESSLMNAFFRNYPLSPIMATQDKNGIITAISNGLYILYYFFTGELYMDGIHIDQLHYSEIAFAESKEFNMFVFTNNSIDNETFFLAKNLFRQRF